MNTAATPSLCIGGKAIGHGIAMGPLKFYTSRSAPPTPTHSTNSVAEETELLSLALKSASEQLEQVYETILQDAGEEQAKIFEIHRMLLEDEDFLDQANSLVSQGFSAAYAVERAAESFAVMLSGLDDEYLSARAADMRDVAARVVSLLTGKPEDDQPKSEQESYIIVAEDLSPSETVKLDRRQILGFVTFGGSPNSHTAILARALGIPALIGVGSIDAANDGKQAIIDADAGCLYISPSPQQLEEFQRRQINHHRRLQSLEALRCKPAVTRDGKHIRLYANIGSSDEAAAALSGDAEGIGLLRSEFLYLSRDTCPDEQTLFDAYRQVAETMQGRPVIIRTLDIGADKQADCIPQAPEQNPALGLRGIRLSMAQPSLFETQLRAICRASAFGNIAVMLPMIALPEEVVECKKILARVQRGLDGEGIEYDSKMQLGIMIETPSAVMMARELADLVDFFSVGTNDLIQYTLAADRQNPAVAELCEYGTEPVFRMISKVAKAAHDAGIWVGVCGELAADTALTQRLIDVGVDELSVSPPYVLPVKDTVIKCN